jgi:hypothetical protein
MTAVRVQFVQTAFVPVNSRPVCGEIAGICYEKDGHLVSSEGRGQRFESSWVRHFSAIFADAPKSSFESPLVSRSDVALAFGMCFPFAPIDTRSDKMRSSLARRVRAGTAPNNGIQPPGAIRYKYRRVRWNRGRVAFPTRYGYRTMAGGARCMATRRLLSGFATGWNQTSRRPLFGGQATKVAHFGFADTDRTILWPIGLLVAMPEWHDIYGYPR